MIRKYISTSILMLFLAVTGFAQQNTFQPGWFVLEPNAKYFIVKGPDTKKTRIKAGQCLIAFEYDKGIYMCNDGLGRIIAVSGEKALTPMEETGRVGILTVDTKAANGSTLRKGALYWIKSVDEAAGNFTVRSAGGKTEKIPNTALLPYATYLSRQQKGKDFKDSE
ncbi:MAG: hypothetical protein ACXWDO_00715 [Bacteroidia bacterium]